jgi:hypothetical protein
MSDIEFEEILTNIRNKGPKHAKLIKILTEEESVYTNKGRLNKSALIRRLRLKNKEIDEIFYECQKEFIR